MDIGFLGSSPMDQSFYDKKTIKIKEEIGEVNSKNRKDLKEKVEKANTIMEQESTHLQFKIHEQTHSVMIKIIKSDTGEVLRELPPEKLVDMIAKICEMAGLFIDKKI